ncbi:MAG: tRNA lysidine(34) synthetase TilS [Alphaproteobacteria bacterium]|nr:tRNA lysidine(34) synthetase TilS [Alphaproteobacteria bacterium]
MPIHSLASVSLTTAAALTPEEFAALMETLDADPRNLAVAVSGGPDSMALAWCAKRWTGDRGGSLSAFIVDHRLRPESGEEAKAVQQRLAAVGVKAEILRWEHSPIASRVHAQARKARYDLLLEACRRHGIRDLLLAHQREDQAETILMRLAKGSGLDGLAGMAAETAMNGVRLLRPLLTVPKERLVATCEAAGLVFVTDSSNSATKYARGRLRRVLPLLEAEGLTVERLIDLGERAGETRDAMEHYAQALLRVAARMDEAGVVSLNLEHVRSAPRAAALHALGDCLRSLHAADYPPQRAMLLPLLEALCRDGPMGARTLHGCIIGKGAVSATLTREYAAITDEKPIAPGETILWDGRWQVHVSPECQMKHLVVRKLGMPLRGELDRLAPDLRRQVPKGRARAVLPSLWQGENLALIPDLTGSPKSMAAAKVLLKPQTRHQT